jgi:hypothetical protein
MLPQNEYIKAIADKLDRLKKASGETANSQIPGPSKWDTFDPFQDMGNSAIDYLKRNGKWPINGDQSS